MRVSAQKLGEVTIVVDVRAETDDAHITFTDLKSNTREIVRHTLERHHSEEFHKGAKYLGLGSTGSGRAKRR